MMKVMAAMTLLLFLGFRPIPPNLRGKTKSEIMKEVKNSTPEQKALVPAQKSFYKPLREKSVRKVFNPTFGREFGTIKTLERLVGVVEGNIVSSGVPVSIKINIKNSSKIPNGSYLSCTGTNLAAKFNYRIITHCDQLITPDAEYNVSVSIKDRKLVDGIDPDYIYTGDEEALFGEGFSAIMGGILDTKQDRVQTAIGFSENPNMKNAILQGLINASKMANQKAKDHTSEQLTILAVLHEKEVIVEFKKRFDYEKE